eukprot:PhM_4_TR11671/c0_g1_i2/m.13343
MEVILALEDTLRGTLATRGHTIFDIRNVVVRIIEEALRFAVDALRQQDFKMCHTLLERAERYTEPSVVSAELQGCFTGAETQRLGLRQKTFRMLCVFEKERCGGHVSKAGIVNRRGSSSGVSRPTKPKVERVVLGQQQQQQQPFAPPRAAPTRREEESGGDVYYDDTTDEDNDDDDDESALPKELSPTSRVPDFTARAVPFLRRVEEELRQGSARGLPKAHRGDGGRCRHDVHALFCDITPTTAAAAPPQLAAATGRDRKCQGAGGGARGGEGGASPRASGAVARQGHAAPHKH